MQQIELTGAEHALDRLMPAVQAGELVVAESAPVQVVMNDGEDSSKILEALRAERARRPEVRLVAVAPEGTLDSRRALEAGADGVVTLERAVDALGPTVRAVAAGQVVVPKESLALANRPALSVREKQILAMVVLGLSNAEIASKLYVTESTVKAHLGASFKKLGVNSRKDAVARILDPESGLGTGILSITDGELSGPSASYGVGP